MIIYNGDKYACISCIRGHRSSTCKHTGRMLVKVRTRGRPSPVDIRDVIMVDVTSRVKRKKLTTKKRSCDDMLIDGNHDHKHEQEIEVEEEEHDHPPGHEDCCRKMDAQPIIYIKARETQKAMVVDGKLKIIVKDPAVDGDAVKYLSEKEFLRNISAQPINNVDTSTSNESNINPSVVDTRLRVNDIPKISKCCDPNHIAKAPSPQDIINDCLSNNDTKTDILSHSTITNIVSPPSTVESNNSGSSSNVGTPVNKIEKTCNSTPNEDLDSKKLSVDVFTHKGLYLSSDCSCPDNGCECINCLIHRNEEELNKYIMQSGVPLTNMIDTSKPSPDDITDCSQLGCQCSLIDCTCQNCSMHPTEIVPFERFFYQGLNNITLRRKTIVKFKHKLIPSEYWWDFLTVELPSVNAETLETIDLKDYFEKLLDKYNHEFLSADSEWGLLNDLEGFYVI
ncbi:metal-binding activator 1 [Monosporozyma unispora]